MKWHTWIDIVRQRPQDILLMIQDRQHYRKAMEALPAAGEISWQFAQVNVTAPRRTDLGAFAEIWLGQVYGLHPQFVPQPEWRVVDVGANIGIFTLWAAIHMRRGRLWAVEPIPVTFDYLNRNVVANHGAFPDLILNTKAVAMGNRVGALPMVIPHESTNSRPMMARKPAPDETCITVPLTTLDAVVPPPQMIDLIKIDVEGAEEIVLQGGQNVLTRTRRIVMEYHNAKLLRDCRERLESARFRQVLSTGASDLGVAYFSK